MNQMTTETDEKQVTVTPLSASVAPKKRNRKKTARRKKTTVAKKSPSRIPQVAPTPKPPGRETKSRTSASRTEQKRAVSKGGMILEMIGQTTGASLTEIMEATRWQAHSVRGFISTAPKKYDVTIESKKNDAGERVYRSIR